MYVIYAFALRHLRDLTLRHSVGFWSVGTKEIESKQNVSLGTTQRRQRCLSQEPVIKNQGCHPDKGGLT